MTAQAVEQYLADESCSESVHTVEELKEEESAFFRVAAPGFTTGELWLAAQWLITSLSTKEEGGRLEEEPIMPTTQTTIRVHAPIFQDGILFKVARYISGVYGRLLGTPVAGRDHAVTGLQKDSTDHLLMSTCCGKQLEKELWSLLTEEEQLEARKAALRRFWSHP